MESESMMSVDVARSETGVRRRRTAPRRVLIAAGSGETDGKALWAGLLELVQGGGDPEAAAGARTPRGTGQPVAWAVDDVETAAGQLRSLLAAGVERALVVPFVTADDAGRTTWAEQLAREMADLRARFPDARLDDLGAAGAPEADVVPGLLTAAQVANARVVADTIERAFGGSPARLAGFVAALRGPLPNGTAIILRGSAVMGSSFRQGVPFDDDGPGTSDLDVVVVGEDAARLWVPQARLLGGVNTLPLDDKAAWVAPSLEPARRAAQAVVGRPTAVQAMAGWFLALRSLLQSQDYVVLSGPA